MMSAAAAAHAALPPNWQRAAEMRAILESEDIAKRLKSEPIDTIEWKSPDLYAVKTASCTLDVRIVSEEQTMPGPRKFRLDPGAGCP